MQHDITIKPLVSIITPLFNSAIYLPQCIESIKAQTMTNWELLITDDCSTDDGFNIAKEYAEKDERIKVYRLSSRSGAAEARNNSIRMALGRYIAFCDSDDYWDSKKLDLQISLMESEGLFFSYTDYESMDEEGHKNLIKAPASLDYSSLLKYNYIGCLTVVYDSEVLGKVYMPNFIKRQDLATWLQITKKGVVAYNIGLKLAVYRKNKGSLSSNKYSLLKYHYQVFRRIHGSGRVVALLMLIRYVFYYFCKDH